MMYVVHHDGHVTAVTETRADGWPICPFCENDELACIAATEPTPEAIDRCYVCGPVRVVTDWTRDEGPGS